MYIYMGTHRKFPGESKRNGHDQYTMVTVNNLARFFKFHCEKIGIFLLLLSAGAHGQQKRKNTKKREIINDETNLMKC